jgi:16S rRNA processing protein RimM
VSAPDSQSEYVGQTGSSNSGEPVFLVIGFFGRPHGVQGEIQFHILSDFPERIVPGKVVYLGARRQAATVARVRAHGDKLLLVVEGYADRDRAALLRNETVYVRGEDVPPLAEGEFYHHELIGLAVVSDEGEPLGILAEILETGANDVFVVRGADGGELLLPSTGQVVKEINPAAGTITIHLIAGLK